MSQAESSSTPPSNSRSYLTIHISRGAFWTLLTALALVAALVIIEARRSKEVQSAPAPASAIAESQAPAAEPTVPTASKPAGMDSEPAPAKSVVVNETSHESVTTTHQSTVNVNVQPPGSEPQAVPATQSIVPIQPVALETLGPLTLNGAGATYPNPLYTKWFSEFHKLAPGIQIDYQSIGSGGGIRQVLAGATDFGATDGPMTDEQLAQSPIKILHIPTVLQAIVPVYNLSSVTGEIRFTPEALAGIFLGKISQWNDPIITSANPGITFPDQPIVVIHRNDGSASTYIFTDYLSKVSAEWREHVGRGTSVKWPIGLVPKGSAGPAGTVMKIDGSIGYVELIYAKQNNLAYGSVRNSSGTFVKADLDNVTEAARSIESMPSDFRVSITDPPGTDAYPIASFTWLLIPQRAQSTERAKAMISFLQWMLAEGKPISKSLGYPPLPKNVSEKVRESVAHLR